MDNFLQQGVAAVKAGDKARAYELLTKATQDTALAEQAWLWLSAVVAQDGERLFCLDNALRINRGNAAAQKGAEMLRQKGVLPAVPLGPAVPDRGQVMPVNPTPGFKVAPPQPASIPNRQPQKSTIPERQSLSQKPVVPVMRSQPQTPAVQPAQWEMAADMSGWVKYAANELAHRKSAKSVTNDLISRGLSPQTATGIVEQTRQAMRKVRKEKYKKQMIAGVFWTAAGIGVTVLTFIFSEQLGGTVVLFYGAIIIGIINLIAGFFGWLSNA